MKTFTIDLDGKTYSGTWHIANGLIHVSSAYGSRAGDIAGHGKNPEAQARVLLTDLVTKRPQP